MPGVSLSHCLRSPGLGYHNINISTSIFIEQCTSGPQKVQSGTFPVLYKLRNAMVEALQLGLILEQARTVTDLSFNVDIQPLIKQQSSFNAQLRIHIIQILAKYVVGFSDYATFIKLQHQHHQQIPAGYITKQYPLKVNTVDKSSIKGQPKVLDNIYSIGPVLATPFLPLFLAHLYIFFCQIFLGI